MDKQHNEDTYRGEIVRGVISAIFNETKNAVIIMNPADSTIIYVNDALKQMFGEDEDKLIGNTCYKLFNYAEKPCANCHACEKSTKDKGYVRKYSKRFDSYLYERIGIIPWIDGSEAVLCTILNTEDILNKEPACTVIPELNIEDLEYDEYMSVKEKLRLSGELYSTVVAQIKTLVFEHNYVNNTFYISPLFKEKFGIDDITNMDFTKSEDVCKIIYPEDMEVYKMLFGNREDDFREVCCRFVDIQGNILWYKVTIQIMRDADGRKTRCIGTIKDVDEATRTYETLRYRVDYDMLTDLPNANRFYIDASRQMIDNSGQNYAVIVFDVEKFKMINDLFDMNTGDNVLRHIGNVLKSKLPEGSLCARIHSDVFAVCVGYRTRGDIIKLIEKIRKGIFANDFTFDINTSYGIYLPTNDMIPVNLMCDRAHIAAKTVKGNVTKFCAFYDEQYREDIIKIREIEQDMRVALKDKQFKMYLQPKINLKDGSIVGAEVLTRWLHPVKGLIMPDDFIPLFERNGFIMELDEYMWEEACKTMRRWLDEGRKPMPLAVNISRYHIKNNDLVKVLTNLVSKYKLAPSMLKLEITETVFSDRLEDLYSVFVKLQSKGFSLAVDDFGSGYSSLNMLRNIPIDTIKIDREFLDKKLSSNKGKIVVSHTIAMAKDLKLNIIAEGVETKEHVKFLQEANCDVAQGYYFARPMYVDEFEKLSF